MGALPVLQSLVTATGWESSGGNDPTLHQSHKCGQGAAVPAAVPAQVLWEQVTPRSLWQSFLPFQAAVCWLQFVFSVTSNLSKCFKERQQPLS